MRLSAISCCFLPSRQVVLLFVLILGLMGCRQTPPTGVVRVGLGSYWPERPAGAAGPSNQAGVPVTPLVTADFDGPVPTNDWWSSLVWNYADEPHSTDLYAHPLVLRATATGLQMRYPTAVEVTDTRYGFSMANDLHVGLDGLAAPGTRAAAASDWTVTAAWDDGTHRLRATFGHGLPFVYFTGSGGDAVVRFDGPPTIWATDGPAVGVTVNGHHYGLFAPRGALWTGTDALRSDLNGQNYFAVAVLPDEASLTLARFQRHAYAFVTDTRVDWRFDEARAQLTTTYTVQTALKEQGDDRVATPLLALYPHQWAHTGARLTDLAYASPRGPMRLLEAGSFQTTLSFGGILPELPAGCAAPDSTLYRLIDQVYTTPDLFPGNLANGDTYWQGKALGRLAELVPLAYDAGHEAAAQRFLGVIKTRLEDWFTAIDDTTYFAYDTTWNTLIGYPAAFGSNTDLNDHHFHYGYHLMAAATVARYDPAWAAPEAWGGMVDLLIRDVANPDRTDPRFPFLRSFDPYAGHGWASGHGAFPEGNNQESSSEAMNFAVGLIRWGVETGDRTLRDLGIYLYSTERTAIESYWFDVDDRIFPPAFDHTTVALVWGNGGHYDTWFGSDPEFVHGINYLPFTGGSYYLGRHPDYVRANHAEMRRRHGTPPDTWPDLMLQFQALADPETAWHAYQELLAAGYQPEAGATRAHTARWLHSLHTLGRVDTTITADVPTYRVFHQQSRRRYVAYNPSETARAVTFSDGFSLMLPPKTQLTACPE